MRDFTKVNEGIRITTLVERLIRQAFDKRWEALSNTNKDEGERGGNDMSVVSVVNGWTCEGCGVNRNTTNEVWRDCECNKSVKQPKRLGLTDWRNIMRNVAESNHEEYGNEVEVMYMDNVPGPGEWALCHGEQLFEDGFKTEDDAEQRLEHITKVIDLQPVASICMSNTGGVVIYECESDYVLAGVNAEVPEYYQIESSPMEDDPEEFEFVFYMGEWELSLGDAMRVNY